MSPNNTERIGSHVFQYPTVTPIDVSSAHHQHNYTVEDRREYGHINEFIGGGTVDKLGESALKQTMTSRYMGLENAKLEAAA
jgi:hypothetical protein